MAVFKFFPEEIYYYVPGVSEVWNDIDKLVTILESRRQIKGDSPEEAETPGTPLLRLIALFGG
jgi:hypothetical protein